MKYVVLKKTNTRIGRGLQAEKPSAFKGIPLSAEGKGTHGIPLR